MISSAAAPVIPRAAIPSRSCTSISLHPPLGPLEAHRAAQLFGLAAREPGRHHRDPQQLLLEQRHAERALEDRFERRMGIAHLLAPGPAVQIRMHHLPDDRARAG